MVVIRVSVVSRHRTGADFAQRIGTGRTGTNAVASGATADSRSGRSDGALRADNQRNAERAQKLETPNAGAGGSHCAAAQLKQRRNARRWRRSPRRSPRRSRSRSRQPRPTAMSRFGRSRRSRHCSRTARSRGSRPTSPRCPRPSFRKRPNARRFARQGCRNSKTCRCLRRTKSGQARGEVDEEASAKNPNVAAAAPRQCGLGRRDEETEPADRGPRLVRRSPMPRCLSASPSARSRNRSRPVTRYRNMPPGPHSRVGRSWPPAPVALRRHRATII